MNRTLKGGKMTEWARTKQDCSKESLRLYGEVDKLSLSDSAKTDLFRVAVDISREAAALLKGLRKEEKGENSHS